MLDLTDSLSFELLRDLYARGLGLTDVLVLAYVRRYRRDGSETIARACGVSERSVYRALRKLRQQQLLPAAP